MASPIGGYIKVIPVEIPEEVKSEGGIIIPVKERKALAEVQCNVGKVVSIGSCAFKGMAENPEDLPQFKVGDVVYYTKFAGNLVKKKNGKPPERILRWDEVRAIVEEDDDLLGLS